MVREKNAVKKNMDMTDEEKRIEAIKTHNSPFVQKKLAQMQRTLELCPIDFEKLRNQ